MFCTDPCRILAVANTILPVIIEIPKYLTPSSLAGVGVSFAFPPGPPRSPYQVMYIPARSDLKSFWCPGRRVMRHCQGFSIYHSASYLIFKSSSYISIRERHSSRSISYSYAILNCNPESNQELKLTEYNKRKKKTLVSLPIDFRRYLTWFWWS